VFFSIQKGIKNLTIAFLVIFIFLWLAYFTFWIIPWHRYALPAMAMILFFISKLFVDITSSFIHSSNELWQGIIHSQNKVENLSPQVFVYFGALIALLSFGLWVGFESQKIVRDDIIDKAGLEVTDIFSPKLYDAPSQTADYLNKTVDQQVIVETWERELGVITNHNYHYPDQSLLARVDNATYHGGPTDYQLGLQYFSAIKPSYIVIGFYARFTNIYDMQFVNQYYELVKSIGYGGWQYDIYKIKREFP
ncbi:MAG TPA: hypothetical protein VF498_11955, partial [Anaerolineales bacterium]